MSDEGGPFEVVRAFVTDGGYGRALATVRAVCGQHEDAEDAVQDALARALARDDVRELGPWVAVVAINIVRASARRAARRSDLSRQPGQPPSTGREHDVELRDLVLDAISQLSARQRDVVVLRYFWDLPVAEIADLLKISPGTVKIQLYRARQHLRTSLAPAVEVDA